MSPAHLSSAKLLRTAMSQRCAALRYTSPRSTDMRRPLRNSDTRTSTSRTNSERLHCSSRATAAMRRSNKERTWTKKERTCVCRCTLRVRGHSEVVHDLLRSGACGRGISGTHIVTPGCQNRKHGDLQDAGACRSIWLRREVTATLFGN